MVCSFVLILGLSISNTRPQYLAVVTYLQEVNEGSCFLLVGFVLQLFPFSSSLILYNFSRSRFWGEQDPHFLLRKLV